MSSQVIHFRPQVWTPCARVVALKLSGLTQQTIAEQLGVERSSISAVLRDRRKSKRIASYISNTLGVPTAILWADGRYEYAATKRTA